MSNPPVIAVNPAQKTSSFATYSTTPATSDNFLFDKMTESLAEYEQDKAALAQTVKKTDFTDPLAGFEIQQRVDVIKRFENVSTAVLGKIKGAFETLVTKAP